MKLTVFQSGMGDCLLLTGADGRRMLIDGGMSNAYDTHVSPFMGNLQAKKQKLDVVYVSHIDADHISGVLKMMNDLVEWRVHDFQKQNDNPNHKEPDVFRPPEIGAIWHNAFHEQVKDNADPITDMLAASAKILSGGESRKLKGLAQIHHNLTSSIPQAIKLSRRISAQQLNIPLNPHSGGKLMLVRDSKEPVMVGDMKVFVIGPHNRDLVILRKKWNEWLEANQEALEQIEAKAKADSADLDKNDVSAITASMLAQAEQFGNRLSVTPPNLASLMLLVEESGKSILLTGDGHADDILKGLEHYEKLDADGRIHVDVLKVQHHGAANNIHADFCEAVKADHYVFCGNGQHSNPEPGVIELIFNSRILDTGNFKMWFNSSSKTADTDENKQHMKMVEKLVKKLALLSGGRMKFFFVRGSKFNLRKL
jgi:beta-lactamase superfamily II metal-dependent hydrolase